VTTATVDTESVVLDALDFAHAPPCEARPCREHPRPAAWRVTYRQCCPTAPPTCLYCGRCVRYVHDFAACAVNLTCRVCGHTMPGRDWVVSVHRIDGGEQS
jgi:hypothetical protein